ncbi:hypothetical protein OGR47_02970 [Methylocystis sp. MJC1]|jgi:hypothetical protein|uniref:hypothetical protein n=1 Tax=Methylocystis sp. MJC1 TaxID=2654282 RepID=UPI0013EE3268|nr:hypothetical protein [Methylocystis sp. MJC1]KAF2991104.1 hypothetical protein MJC1_01836 [Methylocystis sp. MJC1]MBU6525975.1 hypothetical protein [Methylocystis sp. MJC1]UZX12442.1 hypothetical protein OGR47_02970 [Methylocystis sp. MJC1]
MAERPDAYVVHKTPSRIRLKIPERRGDRSFFAHASKWLERIPGVEAKANASTSSILLQGERVAEALSAIGADAPFEIKGSAPAAGLDLEKMRERLEAISASFTRLTGEDARASVVLALLVFGIAQLARGNIGPPGLTLLWYAGEALRDWPSGAVKKSLGASRR